MANINDHFNQSFARQGTKLVSGTSITNIPAGTYMAVQFITKATPTTLQTHYEPGVQYTSAYAQGMILYIDVSDISLPSGQKAILYKRVPC
jgi:hypothetical protein